jgi:hypothetical protein
VVYMTNAAGARFTQPKAVVPAAGVVAVAAEVEAAKAVAKP